MDLDTLIAHAPDVNLPTFPELPEDPREAFAVVLAFRKVGLATADMEAAWEARRLAAYKPAYKAKFPRRKFDKIKAWAELTEITERFDAEGEKLVAAFRELVKQAEAKLDELAALATPVPGETWNVADRINSTSYNTVGFGAHTYAKRAAEGQIPSYAMNGLEAEVRVDRWDDRPDYKPLYGKRSGIADYNVWVKADLLDIEITKRRPGMTMKDWLQWCWSNGVNPRVYNPMLPHGLEAELGVSVNGWTP